MVNLPTTPPEPAAAYDPFVALATVLHQEVAILDDLVFRLVKAELLIEAREARFLGLAIDEIDDRAAELGEVELLASDLIRPRDERARGGLLKPRDLDLLPNTVPE